eukprot:CAMPEP_0172452358 /NCGR_PEP_ID=MMETSP1065-20121228/10051_1 /TAXON_ID=265537 /ORGANISM="Amphiprora paludosa, Strain CCMP125" /LENGTH=111 /DNA_ID=CAMNT_0013204405 /DNA_START=61 /DNA_END=396 /DNA_ORIENTATION=-
MAFAGSAAEGGSNPEGETNAAAGGGDSDIPALPMPDPDADIPSIKLGETIRFEEWGPIILNQDGTTRRIANWDQLTEGEKTATWRRISKRNEERRKVLLEKMKEEGQEPDL